eukprot:7399396-Prorocentrum_lima.AAC.1
MTLTLGAGGAAGQAKYKTLTRSSAKGADLSSIPEAMPRARTQEMINPLLHGSAFVRYFLATFLCRYRKKEGTAHVPADL